MKQINTFEDAKQAVAEKHIRFPIQHNGKGKKHLLNSDLKLLCGSSGMFNFSAFEDVVVIGGVLKVEAVMPRTGSVSHSDLFFPEMCEKCISKALKIKEYYESVAQ